MQHNPTSFFIVVLLSQLPYSYVRGTSVDKTIS